MLKKAGIVVAAAAAGLLAVSPLAFAGESHKDWGGHGTTVASSEQNTEGLVNVTDTNVNLPVNALNCVDVDPIGLVPVDADQIVTPIAGALALFGSKADVEQDTRVSQDCANTQASNAGDTVNQD